MERPIRQDPLSYQFSLIPQPRPARDTTGECGYEGMDSPDELRAAIRELRRVQAWIAQFADLAAEMPDYGLDGVRAIKATGAMVSLLVERAESRLRHLTGRHAAAGEWAPRAS